MKIPYIYLLWGCFWKIEHLFINPENIANLMQIVVAHNVLKQKQFDYTNNLYRLMQKQILRI
jgi:hypothetical protein